MNAIDLLKQDHDKVKRIFDKFEKAGEAEDVEEARQLAEKALVELVVHAKIEEEIYYPAVRAKIEDKDLMDEATEEHHVAKLLIRELADSGLKGERWEAKFCVLAESIKHHIEEEEGEMFPEVRKLELDLEDLGARMMSRKDELTREVMDLKAVRAEDQEPLEARSSRPRRASATRRGRAGRKAHARR